MDIIFTKKIKLKLQEIIFESNTRLGKFFDLILLCAILLSVTAVILESIAAVADRHGEFLTIVEWVFTILFTVEYALRILISKNPRKYIFSAVGIVDLLSIVPTYLSLFIAGEQVLMIIRILRILRIFKILNLWHYMEASQLMIYALKASRVKLIVFIATILTIAMILGAFMYLIEGRTNGFDSILRGFYWAIVTITTVGYGDIHPKTPLGQFIATILMVMGYGIIALPTGIISAEIISRKSSPVEPVKFKLCRKCHREEHDLSAKFCKYCGANLKLLKDLKVQY